MPETTLHADLMPYDDNQLNAGAVNSRFAEVHTAELYVGDTSAGILGYSYVAEFHGNVVMATNYQQLWFDLWTANNYAGANSIFAWWRSRGTLANPTAVLSGDTLGSNLQVFAYHSGDDWASGYVEICKAVENWTATARGVELKHYINLTGTTTWTEFLRYTNAQVLYNAGTAVAPTIARIDYPDDGFFWPADGALALGFGGTERIRFTGTGIGINMTPIAELSMMREDTSVAITSEVYGDTDGWGSYIQHYRAKGSEAIKGAITTNMYMSNWRAYGYDSSAWGEGYRVIVRASENWTTGAHGTYADFLVARSTTTTLQTTLRLKNQQILGSGIGTPSEPTYSFIGYTEDGTYLAANGVWAWALDGVRVGSVIAPGWLALGIATNPAYPVHVADTIAGNMSLFFKNASSDSAAQARLYMYSVGSNPYLLFRSDAGGATYWSAGYDVSESRYAWAPTTNLGSGDRAYLKNTGVWWLYPHSPSFAASGEAAMDSSQNSFDTYVGGATHYNGHTLYAGPATALTDSGNGTHSETAFTGLYSIPANYLKSTKAIRIRAYVKAQTAGSTGAMRIRLRLGGVSGLLVFESITTAGGGSGSEFGNGIIDAIVLCNTTGSGGTVTCFGEGRRILKSADSEGVVTADSYIYYRTAGTQSLNTTTAQAVTVTHEIIAGTPGDWYCTLKMLIVEAIK